MTTEIREATVEVEKPKRRKYYVQVNAHCPVMGAWNGNQTVYRGDEFFLTLDPYMKPQRDPKLEPVLVDRPVPKWLDIIEEYEPDPEPEDPKPLRKKAIPESSTPAIPGTRTVEVRVATPVKVAPEPKPDEPPTTGPKVVAPSGPTTQAQHPKVETGFPTLAEIQEKQKKS